MTKGRVSPQTGAPESNPEPWRELLRPDSTLRVGKQECSPLCGAGSLQFIRPPTLKVVLRLPPSSIPHLLLPPSPCKLLKTEMLYKRLYHSPGSLRGTRHHLKFQTHGLSDPPPWAPTFLAFLTSPPLT